MYSDDAMRSDEVVDFFEECLHERGLESVQVAHQKSHFLDKIYIRKQIAGDEQLVYKTTFDATNSTNTEDGLRKSLALEAANVVEEFNEELLTRFEWGGRQIEVSPYDGGWARCTDCGTRVDAPKAQYLVAESRELSSPMPVNRDMTHQLENMQSHQRVLFKMYLLGLLREQCDIDCQNSKYSTPKALNRISYNR